MSLIAVAQHMVLKCVHELHNFITEEDRPDRPGQGGPDRPGVETSVLEVSLTMLLCNKWY